MIQSEKQPSQVTDQQLLERYISSKSDKAFSELVTRHGSYVVAIARRRLEDSGLAEDAAQQVFILLSKKAKSLVLHPYLRAWLHRAAVFEASNLARKEQRFSRKKALAYQEEDSKEAVKEGVGLDEALASLKASERQILLLHHQDGLTFSEVGARVGISEAAAQKRAHRALKKLTEKMKRAGFSKGNSRHSASLLVALGVKGDGLSSVFVERVVAARAATTSLIPVAAGVATIAVVLGASIVVKARNHPPASSTKKGELVSNTSPEVLVSNVRSVEKPFRPEKTDEELSADVRKFIELAQEDGEKALEFAKEQSEGLARFLDRAVDPLADRDLVAADLFLELVQGVDPRERTVQSIFGSRASRDFGLAVQWVDQLPYESDRIESNRIESNRIESSRESLRNRGGLYQWEMG